MSNLHQHIESEELLRRFFKDNNQQWLGILLERYTILLLGVCMKYLKDEHAARDIVQQVFIKALAEIPKNKIQNLGGWLYQVAKNESITYLKKRKINFNEEEIVNLTDEKQNSIANLLLQDKKETYLVEAMNELKDGQKECLSMFYFENKSYQQIADIKHVSVKQVKSDIQNGKRNLKNLLSTIPLFKKSGHDSE